jgi:hypothetical protein
MLLHFSQCLTDTLPKNRTPVIAAEIGMPSVSVQAVPESCFGGGCYRVCPDPHYSQGFLVFAKFSILEEEIHPVFWPPALARAVA